MATALTESDEGKPVVFNDETVGRVVDVEHGTAYVDPDPGIAETIKSKLGWAEADEETFALDDDAVGEVTGDEVRLTTST